MGVRAHASADMGKAELEFWASQLPSAFVNRRGNFFSQPQLECTCRLRKGFNRARLKSFLG